MSEYAEALREGAVFLPVLVVRDGANSWLVDGFHVPRPTAAAREDRRGGGDGTRRRRAALAVGHVAHGLRRSNADKRKAVLTMLTNELVATDDEGTPWSTEKSHGRCCVSLDLVNRLRDSLERIAQ